MTAWRARLRPLTAAILIGHTAGNERFRSEAAFRAADGNRANPVFLRQTHPTPAQPRRRPATQPRAAHHRRHRAQHDPTTKQYLARKQAEGKTKKGALRSLKRHLARRFHQLLSEPPADQQPTSEPTSIIEPELPTIPDRPKPRREVEQITAAPSPMVCIS